MPILVARSVGGRWYPYAWPMSDSVKSQDADEIFPDWNQSGLPEFGFSNRKGSISEVCICVLQADCLAQS